MAQLASLTVAWIKMSGLNLGGNATFNSRSYFCSFDGSVVTNCFDGNTSHTATGWTAGAGIEFAAWNNFSIKMEYLYIHLGNDNVNVVAQATIRPNLFLLHSAPLMIGLSLMWRAWASITNLIDVCE